MYFLPIPKRTERTGGHRRTTQTITRQPPNNTPKALTHLEDTSAPNPVAKRRIDRLPQKVLDNSRFEWPERSAKIPLRSPRSSAGVLEGVFMITATSLQ
jgi:hypothetical protein